MIYKNSMTGRVLGIVLAFAMVFTGMFSPIAGNFGTYVYADDTNLAGSLGTAPTLEGEGTEGNPYLIGTAEELKAFRDMVNEGDNKALHAKLTADVDLENEDWEPIGGITSDAAKGYAGTFDGNGKKVKHLVIDSEPSDANAGIGFFGIINGATVENLTVEGGTVVGKTYCVGGIAGRVESTTTIKDCLYTGSVTNDKTGTSSGTGGIVGAIKNTSGTKIINCANYASVESTGTQGCIGGIIGYTGGGKYYEIENCYNAGTIKGKKAPSTKIGGIAGNANGDTNELAIIKNSYNIGDIVTEGGSSAPCRGRIAGSCVSADIISCAGIDISDEKFARSNSTTLEITKIEQTDAGKAALLAALNKNGKQYSADFAGDDAINNGYPILCWQKGETAGGTTVEPDPAPTEPTKVKAIANFYDGSDKTQLIAYGEYEATAGLALSYGYSTGSAKTHAKNNEVTTLDMLVAMIAESYGITGPKDENASLLTDTLKVSSTGTVDKIFGESTASKPFSLVQNGIMPNDGDFSNLYANGYMIDDAVIADGDLLNYFFYQDTSYADYCGTFTQNGTAVTSITVPAGEAFTVGLHGYSFMYYGACPPEVIKEKTEKLTDIQLALSNAGTTLEDITGAKTDENGNVTLTFNKEGTYIVTATGNDNTPLIAPYLCVHVKTITDEERANTVNSDKDALTFDTIKGENTTSGAVTKKLTLPQAGKSGRTAVTWSSSDENVIKTDGSVIRPANEVGDKKVTLTAKIKFDSAEVTKTFEITVTAMPQEDIPAAKDNLDEAKKLAKGIFDYYAGKDDGWWGSQVKFWQILGIESYRNSIDKTEKDIADSAKQALTDSIVNAASVQNSKQHDNANALGQAIIALAAMGYSPDNVLSVNRTVINLPKKLQSMNFDEVKTTSYKTLAPYVQFALLQGNYGDTEFKKQNYEYILKNISDDANYKLGFDTPAMIASGLTPYYGKEQAATDALNAFVTNFSEKQNNKGSFGNANTNAVVVVTLCQLGINPDTDERFIKNGNSL
nr:hypothetical protein [Clostridia bacterium]